MTKTSVPNKLPILALILIIPFLFKPRPARSQAVRGIEGQDYVSGELIVKYGSEAAANIDAENNNNKSGFLRNFFGDASPADLDRKFAVYEKISFLDFAGQGGQRGRRTIKFGKLGLTPRPEQSPSLVYLLKFRQKTVAEAAAAYNANPGVEYAEPNYIAKISETPDDKYFSRLWNLEKIEAPQAWQITKGSASIVVAMLDTGADYNHPDLDGNLISGYDIVHDDSDPRDDQGHGTHVAGTIGAETNNQIGIAGINWQVGLMPVKVCDRSGNCPDWWIAQGLYWAVDHGAKVINMSLGGPHSSQTMREAIAHAVANGATPVAAAGNDASSAPMYPAQYDGVISVAASTQSDNRASFSNFYSGNDISAPGVGICSTTVGGGYQCWAGTSMASPHVAGAAALLLSHFSDLSPARIAQRLKSTADDVADPRLPKRLNLYRALSEGGVTPGPTAIATPTDAPAATATPGGPTSTPTPTSPADADETSPGPVSSCSKVKKNGEIAIWNCYYDTANGQEILLADGDQRKKGQYVAICYNRLAGSVSLTVDRGAGLVDTYHGNFSSPRGGGCLHSGDRIYFPLGDLASSAGSPHVYTLNNGGRSVSASVLVSTGAVPTPTAVPVSTVSPSPAATTAPTPTADPNASPTPTAMPSADIVKKVIDAVSEQNLRDHLSNLVDDDEIVGRDEQQTRYSRYSGNDTEAAYIRRQFENLGIQTELQNFGFTTAGVRFDTQNIIGKIPGSNPDEVYLITAHMDSTAARSGTNDPAPGADDNGSGTAAVLETARVFKTVAPQLNFSLEFVLFSGEEQGLLGSQYYVRNLPSGKNIKGVVNLDMIANRGADDCTTFGYKPYNGGDVISDKIVAINDDYHIGLNTNSRPTTVGASDHKSFWDAGIPAVFGFECSFSPVYHTTGDQSDHINFAQLTKTTRAVAGAIASLTNEN